MAIVLVTEDGLTLQEVGGGRFVLKIGGIGGRWAHKIGGKLAPKQGEMDTQSRWEMGG